jgi:tetratricopeptide (TPR) repeat protein
MFLEFMSLVKAAVVVAIGAAKCEQLANDPSIAAEERAKVLLMLGDNARWNAKHFRLLSDEEKQKKLYAYWDRAVETAPELAISYLSIAWYRIKDGDQPKAVETLRQGLRKIPNEPRLQADLAKYLSPSNESEVVDLCVQATKHPKADRTVFESCAFAMRSLNRIDEAAALYRKSVLDFDPNQDLRFGMLGQERGYAALLDMLMKNGREQDAMDFITDFWDKYPFLILQPSDTELFARVAAKVGSDRSSAELAGRLLASPFMTDEKRSALRIQKLVSLAKSGDIRQASGFAKSVFAKPYKREVLMLQVALKNGSQKHIAITGQFDKETQDAMMACIVDRGCFADAPGQAL